MTRMEKFKSIVSRRTFNRVEGTPVDLFTAQAVVTVYEALSAANRERFLSMPVSRMCATALRLANRVRV